MKPTGQPHVRPAGARALPRTAPVALAPLETWLWAGLRALHRLIGALMPDTRARQLRAELSFWRQWIATQGLHWPDDYALRFDPAAPVQDHISVYLDRIDRKRVELLDVGAGPVTKVGKIRAGKRLSIIAIDVLADEYNALLAEFGIHPPVVTRPGDAQRLRRQFGDRRFDIVHAENALDHMADPVEALREMLAVTKRGGFVLLLHARNEGRRECYRDLHKWDFAREAGRFIIRGPGPNGSRKDLTALFRDQADIECSLLDGHVFVALRKP